MGFFKEIGDWFSDLFKESVSKQDEQKLINKLAGMEVNERKRLEEIVKNYAESFRPKDKEFEYLEEYVPIDEETLRKVSEDKYSQIYNDEKDKANTNYAEKISKLEQTEKGYIDDAENKSEYYTEKYKDKTDDFKSTASKNGIADSSINSAKKEDLNRERDEYIADVMNALTNKLNTTGNKKEELLEEKNSKIENLDASFTKKVEDLFNKMLDEENKKVKEVEKANKETADKEKEYKEYQEKVVKDKASEMEENHRKMKEKEDIGVYDSLQRAEEFDKRFELAKEFYSKFSKKSALESITQNDSLKKFLGSKYYRLIEEIKNG